MWGNARQKKTTWQAVIGPLRIRVVENKRQIREILEVESIIPGDGLNMGARQEEESQGDLKLVERKMVM